MAKQPKTATPIEQAETPAEQVEGVEAQTETPAEQVEGQVPEAETPEASAEQSEETQVTSDESADTTEQPTAEEAPVATPSKMITVTVPRGFQLRVDDHTVLPVKAGVQEMLEEHALHWYSVANGVTVYNPEA